MPAAYFALTPDEDVWEAVVGAIGAERAELLIDAALARLRSFLPTAAEAMRDGSSPTTILVVHPQLPEEEIDAWALSIERVACAEPYRPTRVAAAAAPPAAAAGARQGTPDDGPLFLPLPCAGVMGIPPAQSSGWAESRQDGFARAKKAVVVARRISAAVVWNGTIESSRLVLYSASANIGGDDSCEIRVSAVDRAVAKVEVVDHVGVVAPLGDPPHHVLLDGQPLTPQRFGGGSAMLFIPPHRQGQEPSTIILFNRLSKVVQFQTRDSLGAEGREGREGSPWACNALARASLSAASYGLILLVSREPPDVIERWRRLILSVDIPRGKRDLSLSEDGIAIVIEASPSDIDDYSESLREAFFDDPVVVVSTRATTGELPRAILERARGCARAMGHH